MDFSDGVLHREVVWQNTKGQKTRFNFKRFASFSDDQIYCMQVEMEPLNYSETVKILSGMDLKDKHGGTKDGIHSGCAFESKRKAKV